MVRKRAILLLLVIALAVGNIIWIAAQTNQEIEDFRVDLTLHAIDYGTESDEKNPLFEPTASRWSLHGRPLHSLAPYLVDTDPSNAGPDGIGEFLPFRLPAGSGSEEVRRAFLALASRGICQVAILYQATWVDGTFPLVRQHIVTDDSPTAGAII